VRVGTLARALVLAGAVLGLQALVLWRAFHGGPLSGLIPWDDCLIALRQLYNLRILAGASAADVLPRVGAVIVHSPVSDLPVAAGLLLSGGAVWGAYALNGLVVLAALQVALVRAGRWPPLLFAALAATALLQPMTVSALTFLKADWKAGVLMAAAVFTLHAAARAGDRALKLWGAGLLGLAAAAKLTAFYGPLFALVVFAAFEALAFAARRLDDPSLRLADHLAAERPILAPAAALVLGPYIAFYLFGVLGQHGLLGYIVFALGDAWDDGLSLPQRAAFYSPFSANPAWSLLSWHLLGVGGAALAVSILRRAWLFVLTLAVLFGLALMHLAPLAVARTSNPEFGALVVGIALGAVLISVRTCAEAFPRFGAAACLALSLALAVVVPPAAALFPPAQAPTLAELEGLEATYRRIVADVAARSPSGPPQTLVLYEHLYAPFPNLSLLYRERTGALMDVDRVDVLDSAPPRLAQTDFVLTLVPSGGEVRGLEPRFPTSRDPAGADRFVAAQGRFARVGAYPVPGGELHLYQARRPRPASTT
jgi:hypothetical protein